MPAFGACCALPKGGCLAEKGAVEPSQAPWTHLAACLQSTLRNSDESSCCYILFSLLPRGSGNCMFVFIPFWFMFPFVAVFLTDPPDWVPDEVCSYCTACKAPFTVIRRKHHCRSCGKVMIQLNTWETPRQREQQMYVYHRNSAAQQNVCAWPGFSSHRCFCTSWLSTAQLKFRKWGGRFWLLYSNKDLFSKKQNCLLRSWNKHPKSRVSLDYCSEFNKLQQPALWGMMYRLAAGTVCPFAFFLNLCRRTAVCRAAALQDCGGGRRSEGE